jgi:hypothetical protein
MPVIMAGQSRHWQDPDDVVKVKRAVGQTASAPGLTDVEIVVGTRTADIHRNCQEGKGRKMTMANAYYPHRYLLGRKIG